MAIRKNPSQIEETGNPIILNFIRQFTNNGKWDQVIESFTCGNCYYFALILKNRFPEGEIIYNAVENHFAYQLDQNAYDISGTIHLSDSWHNWDAYFDIDSIHAERIKRYCIDIV